MGSPSLWVGDGVKNKKTGWRADLTAKRERFITEYLIDLDPKRAAIRAGYSPKSAAGQGYRLLAQGSVRTRVDEEIALRSKRTGINADRVVRELAKVAFVNAADVIDCGSETMGPGADENTAAAIASVKIKGIPAEKGSGVEREIKLSDRLKALELLGRHLGMFTDNVRLTGGVGVKIVNDIPRGTDPAD